MTAPSRFRDWPFVVLLLALAALHLTGLSAVPFHPDEATYLYTSLDVDDFAAHPLSLAWTPASADPRQSHRLLDAPLVRYLLGGARALFGLPAPPADWDWGLSWEANRAAGALPDGKLLWVGRLAVTLLLPLSLTFLYLTGRAASGRVAGWTAALLLGAHALVLVHDRRAMAEGLLTLGLTFALWSLRHADRRPWLAGLALAGALNAKQFAGALIPVGLLAVLWSGSAGWRGWRRVLLNGLQVGAVLVVVTLALNPVLWRDPPGALGAMLDARRELAARQIADAARLAPAQVLDSPGERAVALLANLYLLPPSFAEVGDYQSETAPAEAAYLANPLHQLGRGLLGGGLLLVLTVFGLIAAALQLRRETPGKRRVLLLLLLATASLWALMLAVTPLPWQRYAVPLLPLAALWGGYGVGRLAGAAGLASG